MKIGAKHHQKKRLNHKQNWFLKVLHSDKKLKE